MPNNAIRRAAAVLCAFAVLSGAAAVAQSAPPSPRSISFPKLPNSEIEGFKANPRGLLTEYPSAGLPLSTRARNLFLSDPDLLATLVDLAKDATDPQRAAIGAGLAEAARMLAAVDPQKAAQIQAAIAQSGVDMLIAAFVAGAGGVRTAATGGAAGGAGGAGSGGQIGGVTTLSGSNVGSSSGGQSFGASNNASPSYSVGAGGGLTYPTSQSTSPSKSSL
ncbi:MAG TPA: hypothetical protein VGH40_09515 [Roseiarcus sp.]